MARALVSKTRCCRFESYLACYSSSYKEKVMKKLMRYFKESYLELKKVVWPSKEEVVVSTKVVIISTAIFAFILGLVDFLLVQGVDLIF
jgi:preprotein translocase subunit SecE